MVIAAGSYPAGRWFESDRRYQITIRRCRFLHKSALWLKKIWPLGQAVKTSPFHGGNMGSNPVGVTKQVKGEPVSIRRRIRLYRIFQKALLDEKRRARIYLTRCFLIFCNLCKELFCAIRRACYRNQSTGRLLFSDRKYAILEYCENVQK